MAGNINQLIFRLGPYVSNLEKSHGVMGEFVNPKYADAAKTVFKKPTRLECMMQDYPKVGQPPLACTHVEEYSMYTRPTTAVEPASPRWLGPQNALQAGCPFTSRCLTFQMPSSTVLP